MHRKTLVLCGLTLCFTVACHKTVPLATKAIPAAPTPSTPPPAQPVVRPTPAPVARTQPPQSTLGRSGTMTAQERETLNQRLAHLSDALFDYDKANIRSDAFTALSGDVGVVKDILSNYPNQKLIVEGGADERGSAEYNLLLGDKRAHAAEDFLVNLGIPQTQLTIVSYGKEQPVCEEHNESCWQKNRRAHITAAP